jgi:hypothetical protein
VTTIPSESPGVNEPIDLNRRFFEVPKGLTGDLGQYLSVAAVLKELSTWDDVLAGDCSIILGEAGSGKTTELRQRTKICRESGQAAFFLPIEALASAGLSGGLDPVENRHFEEWYRGNGIGVFFLDSLDEAKLGRLKLETALRKLGHDLNKAKAIARVRIVISCRVSDWDIYGDHTVATRALEWKASASDKSEHGVAPLRIFGMAPLEITQVRALALHIGVSCVDDFIAAIEKSNAGMFVERPADVRWLATYWRRYGQLGSLRELVNENAREKLRDSDRPTQGRKLSEECAWEGALRLAGAAALTGRISFVALGNGRDEPNPTRDLDPSAMLNDWSPEEIAELLRLPLFDESTFGRVRIHERTVQEYLAAAWLRSLLDKGLPRRALDGLLFPLTPHRPSHVVAPHLRATAAWLALDDQPTRKRLAEIDPTVLLGEGDPSGIPIDERRIILIAYADRFRGRQRIFHRLGRRALGRFVCEDLADTISNLVSDNTLPDEARCALLTMAAEGGIWACAKTAVQIATDLKEPSAVRAEAVMAAGTIASSASGRPDILVLMEEPNLNQSICDAMLRVLFPTSITDDEVVALLLSAARRSRSLFTGFTGLQQFFEYELDRRCPPGRRLPLAGKLLGIMRNPALQSLDWLGRSLAILLGSSLRGQPDGETISPELEETFVYYETAKKQYLVLDNSTEEDLAKLMLGRPRMRRKLFWNKVRSAESTKGKRITQYHHLNTYYWILELSKEDLGWLADDALNGPDEPSCILAFNSILWIDCRDEDTAEREALIERLVAESDVLAKHLKRRKNTWSLTDLADREQQIRRMKIRESDRDRQHDDDKSLLESEAEEIRKGENLEALWHLYCVCGGQGIGCGRDNREKIAKRYGYQVATDFLEGIKMFWRKAIVPTPLEWNKQGLQRHAMLGLAGISLEVEAGLNLCDLNPELRRLAIRTALWEVNGFPAWFDGLVTVEQEETRAVLLPLIKQEMEADGSELRSLQLGQICRASQSVRSLVAPAIIQFLLLAEPKRLDVLESVLECIGSAEVDATALEVLAPSRCQAAEADPKRLAVWLVFWINRNGPRAIEYLSSILSSRETIQAGELVEEVLNRIWHSTDSQMEFPFIRIHQNADTIARLIPIAFSHVQRTADLHHGSVYSPGRRDNAQYMRDRLLSWLSNMPPHESLPHLRKLATLPELAELREYLLVQIDERTTADSSCAPWLPKDVVDWSSLYTRQPQNSFELFKAVWDVLLDIKAEFEDGDHSNKQLFNPNEPILEKFVQRELVKEINHKAANRFVAVAEEEIGEDNYPDVRVRKPGSPGAITVEVKVAERWTYNELRTSISNQIAERYLRDPNSIFGILAIASSGKLHGWKMDNGTRLFTFADLVAQLRRDALQIQNEIGMKTITVVEIDFH